MADIQSGLTEGFPDVNTPDGFAAALADKVGAEVPDDVVQELKNSDTSISAGLTESPQSAQEPVAEGEPTPEVPDESGQTDEEQETPALDAAVQEYVEKHGGTPEQALAALYSEFQNAQQFIGRQSDEVGTLRQRLDAMEQYLSQPQQQETFDAPLPTGANEELETFFEERGPEPAMRWIVDNRPDLIEDAISVWSGYDETAATRFATRYDRFLEEETKQPAAPSQSSEDPFLAQMKAEAAWTEAVDQARAASNFSDEEWESVKDHIIPAFEDESTSALIKKAVAQPANQAEHVEGMKALMQLAKSRALTAATNQATDAAKADQQQSAVARKKAAQVATGSLTPPQPKGQSDEEGESREDRIARFKQGLLDAETTDVHAGLTYGPQR